MRKTHALPPLDLLVGFEAAARHLSFTRAAEELFLTQSAISRQIKELEDGLGVALFERRHRALALTDAGKQFYASAAQVLATMRTATEALRAQAGRRRPLSVTTTTSFASLWLIPRLAGFTRDHPGIDVRITADTRVQDLERDGLDVAIRHGPAALAGPDAVRLFGERVFPVCSPKLLKKAPLEKPADLARHVLLQYDDPDIRHPWLHWKTWLEVAGIPELRPAGTLAFSGYDQIIPAAVAGHGVALGRSPLVKGFLERGELVAPFKGSSANPARAYYAILSKGASQRPEALAFV
ncbi:MAG TPA: LysR substrate-binding domain-containing protein, partial [Burkholderiales bacterium]|nr:LysR substrate-binding domain-containing protein [Burkholderiales bacterium]